MCFGRKKTLDGLSPIAKLVLTESLDLVIAQGVGNQYKGLRQAVAMRGLYAKFTQNDELRQKLLDTEDAYLVECAYKDLNWACGWHRFDLPRKDIAQWRGKNLLGFALMEVRGQIRNGSGSICRV